MMEEQARSLREQDSGGFLALHGFGTIREKLVRAVIYTENKENKEKIALTRVGEAERESYGVRESQDEL
jgi:hypothetical protein